MSYKIQRKALAQSLGSNHPCLWWWSYRSIFLSVKIALDKIFQVLSCENSILIIFLYSDRITQYRTTDPTTAVLAQLISQSVSWLLVWEVSCLMWQNLAEVVSGVWLVSYRRSKRWEGESKWQILQSGLVTGMFRPKAKRQSPFKE